MRKVLFAFVWTLFGFVAAAAEMPPAAEPRFFLEEVEVLGLRHAKPDIVLAESLLVAGQDYGEAELGAAMDRIRRLPFVLDAAFALRKGSTRGRYRLEIEVEETLRFFFGQNLVYTRFTNSLAINDFLADNYSISPGGLAGARFFAGRYTMLFASVSSGEGLQAGLTRYNLFDRRIFLSLGVESAHCCGDEVYPLGIDPTFSNWSGINDHRKYSFTLGMPIARSQSLRLQLTRRTSEFGERRSLLGLEKNRASLDYRDLVHDQIEFAFIRDTTDDPVLPSRGIVLAAFFDAQNFEAFPQNTPRVLGPNIELAAGVPAILPEFEARQVRLAVSVQQHFPLGSRQVFSGSARVGVGLAAVENLPIVVDLGDRAILRLVEQEDLELLEGYFTLKYSVALWSAEKARERGDLRLEAGLEFGYDHTTPDLGINNNPLYRKGASAGCVFRNRWGVFRFTFQVADYGRGF